MGNPEEWPDITAVTFATPDDAKKMAEILNDVFLKLEILRKEVLELRQLSHHNNWSVGPMG
jgi:hypothetical protein